MYRQYDLQQFVLDDGVKRDRRITAWLWSNRKLALGAQVTLAGDGGAAPMPGWWKVVRVGVPALPTPPDPRWRVGGLA
jgi:hypothetical protein